MGSFSIVEVRWVSFDDFVDEVKNSISFNLLVGNIFSCRQFIQNQSYSPHITFVIIFSVEAYSFGTPKMIERLHVDTNVNKSVGDSQGVFDIFSNTKIRYFDLSSIIHEYIFRFDVSVNLVLDFVDMVQPFEDLELVKRLHW